MARSRIKYELISDDRTRRETFKKRKKGLFKKLNELKVLCNIDVCGVIIDDTRGQQPEVWPSHHDATRVIQRFDELPSSSKSVNMLDQTRYLRLNVARINSNLEKESSKVRSWEKELFLGRCLMDDGAVKAAATDDDDDAAFGLEEMLRLVEMKIVLVDRRIAEIGIPSTSTAKQRDGKGKAPLG
ncbi:hypothetical protein M569_17664 [Genlisea aurea]|uniref:MADS-box domain-containing protein n=1 Tax=Genlisea aurea TaxID=192259 RepID=S8DCS1_9LAMI|nr:hypothetical protein M569_17664 [Genlisea aurea]